jgi:superfamily II DNA/RNA helicase
MGFEDDVKAISGLMDAQVWTLMLSATWDHRTFDLAASLLAPGALYLQVGNSGLQAARTVSQHVEVMRGKGAPRFRRLCQLLHGFLEQPEPVPSAAAAKDNVSSEHGGGDATSQSTVAAADGAAEGREAVLSAGANEPGEPRLVDLDAAKVLVFVLYKKEARDVARALADKGFAAAQIQGDMSQSARQAVMDRFRSGEVQVLVVRIGGNIPAAALREQHHRGSVLVALLLSYAGGAFHNA